MSIQNKLIREGRFGPPKCWKTGSVVSTYPKPLLVMQFDKAGTEVIETGVQILEPESKLLTEYSNKEQKSLPEITAVDFHIGYAPKISENYSPAADSAPFRRIAACSNVVAGKCPWATVVWDSTTYLSDFIYAHLSATNGGMLADPRKWAPAIGQKIASMITTAFCIPSHQVFIMHEQTEKNELTQAVRQQPMIYSTYREVVSGAMSQFFYQYSDNGVPTLRTKDTGFIKGIGARWPHNLPERITPPTYAEIYEKVYAKK
jgi:hypothetical protein